jgi:acetyl-CoA synthetase
MLPHIRDYAALYREFRWPKLERYNIGVDVCDRWAELDPGRLAIVYVRPDGKSEDISYGALREASNRLANTLAAHGIARGDRVAILLPQAPEAAIAHIAIYKLGAIALPLAILFGVDALSYRLQNAGAKAVITTRKGSRSYLKFAPTCRMYRSCCPSMARRVARSASTTRSRVRPTISRPQQRRRTIPR